MKLRARNQFKGTVVELKPGAVSYVVIKASEAMLAAD